MESNRKYALLRDNYGNIKSKVKELEGQLASLEKRDNEVYRSIFDANPLPDSARAKAIEKQQELDKVNVMDDDELGKTVAEQLNNLSARMAFQVKSYSQIEKLINNHYEMLNYTTFLKKNVIG